VTMDDDNAAIDQEIVDQERAAALERMAAARIRELDWQREDDHERAENDLLRQMADLERESEREP